MKTVEGLYYSESHEWVKVDGEVAIIGITDFAQKAMGDIVYVDMPEVDDEVSAGENQEVQIFDRKTGKYLSRLGTGSWPQEQTSIPIKLATLHKHLSEVSIRLLCKRLHLIEVILHPIAKLDITIPRLICL